MKTIVIVLILIAVFAAGVGGGYLFLKKNRDQKFSESAAPPIASPVENSSTHGISVEIPPNAVVCAIHNVPEVVDPFCNSNLIEDLGYCGGHDVAEALCTRCNPVIIPAFKAENDWCAEHALPESQCAICLGESPASTSG